MDAVQVPEPSVAAGVLKAVPPVREEVDEQDADAGRCPQGEVGPDPSRAQTLGGEVSEGDVDERGDDDRGQDRQEVEEQINLQRAPGSGRTVGSRQPLLEAADPHEQHDGPAQRGYEAGEPKDVDLDEPKADARGQQQGRCVGAKEPLPERKGSGGRVAHRFEVGNLLNPSGRVNARIHMAFAEFARRVCARRRRRPSREGESVAMSPKGPARAANLRAFAVFICGAGSVCCASWSARERHQSSPFGKR